MKTLMLNYTDGINISGSFTTFTDLCINLNRFVDIDFKIIFDIDSIGIMRYFKLQNFFGDGKLMSGLTKENSFESDIIIITCEFLAELIHNKINVHVSCDRLILLDTLDLQRFKYSGYIPNIKNHINFGECILLGNPANENVLPFKHVKYYHKFSEARLKTLNLPHETYHYKRTDKPHIKVGDDIYFENIGKSIFENMFEGNSINYNPNGLKIKDGLCFYLEKLGVDPWIYHENLTVKLQLLIDHLLFNKDDKILEVL